MTSHCPNWCSQLKNFLPCQPDRINNWTIQIFKDFTSGVEVVIMIRRKKERSKQNFILIMNHPLISSVGGNGVSKYLEDIRFWNETKLLLRLQENKIQEIVYFLSQIRGNNTITGTVCHTLVSTSLTMSMPNVQVCTTENSTVDIGTS